jgi:hypothetical protein
MAQLRGLIKQADPEVSTVVMQTARLDLVLESTEAVLARIDAMSPADRAEVSPDWLARLCAATPSPWTHGFALVEQKSGLMVGSAAFKGPPDAHPSRIQRVRPSADCLRV